MKDSLLQAYVVVKTSNLVISRRRDAEDRKPTCRFLNSLLKESEQLIQWRNNLMKEWIRMSEWCINEWVNE